MPSIGAVTLMVLLRFSGLRLSVLICISFSFCFKLA
jgi:hypothetical protein